MPNLIDCINKAVEAGEMSATRGEELRQRMKQYRDTLRSQGRSRADAESAASALALDQFDAAARKQAQRQELQAARLRTLEADAAERVNAKGMIDGPETLYREVKGTDRTARLIFAMWQRELSEFLRDTAPFSPGVRIPGREAQRRVTKLADFGRVIMGEAAEDPSIQPWADAYLRIQQRYVALANELGADITFMERRLPVAHAKGKIAAISNRLRRTGVEADEADIRAPDIWVDEIMPLLDRDRMIDFSTGNPFNDTRLREFLRGVYDSIMTDGAIDRVNGGRSGRVSFLNQMSQSRRLIWKDFDSYAAYQKRYGEGDLFAAINEDMVAQSRELAILQHLGPYPDATIQWMDDIIETWRHQWATERSGPFPSRAGAGTRHKNLGKDYASGKKDSIARVYGMLRGTNAEPLSVRGAMIAGTADNLAISGALSATTLLAAPTDALSQVRVRNFNRMFDGGKRFGNIPVLSQLEELLGVARSTADVAGGVAKQIVSRRARMEAMDALVVVDAYMNSMGDQVRLIGEAAYAGWGRRLPSFTFTANGLMGWTQSTRSAHGNIMWRWFAQNASRSWDDLDPNIRFSFEQSGLIKKDWEAIRATPPSQRRGFDEIQPSDILARSDLDASSARALASRFYNTFDHLLERGTPTGTIEARSKTAGFATGGSVGGIKLRPGSPELIVWQSFSRLKTFITQIMQTWHRDTIGRAWNNGRYKGHGQGLMTAGHFLAAYTVFASMGGALAIQLQNIAAGRDMEEMDWRFWRRAMIKGGGLGFAGDFFDRAMNEHGQGFSTVLWGPGLNFTADTVGALPLDELGDYAMETMLGPALGEDPVSHQDALDDAYSEALKEMRKYAERWVPVVNGWPTNLLWDHMVVQAAHNMADPEAAQKYSDQKIKSAADRGLSFYYPPGEFLPERPPQAQPDLEQ